MNVWLWNQQDHRFEEPTTDISSSKLMAADSWLVEDGRVRAFDLHRTRFGDAAAQVGMGDVITDDFWAAVVEKIPAKGEWFPRVDVLDVSPDAERELAFRLRPAPTRKQELKVLIPPYSDPRITPNRKGPDIALLERVREDAGEQYSCDEVLLINGDGYVIEGATTSLLWWDEETLCAQDPELGALPGVTSAVILEEARARSVPIELRRVRPEELIEHEAWLVNALHGIRRVSELVDGRDFHDSVQRGDEPNQAWTKRRSGPHADAVRLGRWREWLETIRVAPGM